MDAEKGERSRAIFHDILTPFLKICYCDHNFLLLLFLCFLFQGDKKSPMSQVVIQAVSLALDELVFSVEEGTAYGDLQALGRYIQWSIDFRAYESALDQHRVEIRNAEIRRATLATARFRDMNGRLYEEVLWDWSPLWRILSSDEDLLRKMPPMPWCHDGKLLSINLSFNNVFVAYVFGPHSVLQRIL